LDLSERQLPDLVLEALGCQEELPLEEEEEDADLERAAVGDALARLDHQEWFVFGGLADMAV
jgi:hypothetical protein